MSKKFKIVITCVIVVVLLLALIAMSLIFRLKKDGADEFMQ